MTVTVSGESEADWDGHSGVKGVLFRIWVAFQGRGLNGFRVWINAVSLLSQMVRLIDGNEERVLVESKSQGSLNYSTHLLIQAQDYATLSLNG
jgi:hypothetical protein